MAARVVSIHTILAVDISEDEAISIKGNLETLGIWVTYWPTTAAAAIHIGQVDLGIPQAAPESVKAFAKMFIEGFNARRTMEQL